MYELQLGITVDRYLPQTYCMIANIRTFTVHEGLIQKFALPWDAQIHQENCFGSFILKDSSYPD